MQPLADKGETGSRRHADRNDRRQDRRLARLQQAESASQREQHKSEFAGLAEHQGRVDAVGQRNTADPAEDSRDRRFEHDQTDHQPQHQQGFFGDDTEIEADPDGHEEQAEQQPAERLDIGGDLMPVFGFRQQQPGKKPANRQRQPERAGQPAHPQQDR
jgi:hypothetical protein